MTSKHRTYDVLGILMKFHAFPDERDGKFLAVSCVVPPGAGAPANRHPGETESFYVTEGTIRFEIDGRTTEAGPGDFVSIPDGAVHAFFATGDTPAKVLIVNAPGKMHETFFTGIGDPLPEDQNQLPTPKAPDFERLGRVALEAGLEFIAPAEA